MGLSPPPLQRHSALHVIWGLVRVTSPHPVSSPAPRQVQTILGENWKNLFNLQIQDPLGHALFVFWYKNFPFRYWHHSTIKCYQNSIALLTRAFPWWSCVWRPQQAVGCSSPSSIKIEIGLGQDKGRQTALKRRSQEIKAFLIVPPGPRTRSCLITA